MALYSWQSPSLTYAAALLAATPFVLAAWLSPALLSLSPTVEMIAPIAEARAVFNQEISLQIVSAPFYLILLGLSDVIADTPGRIHLVSKALSALLVVAPMAYFAVSRLPVLPGAVLTGAFAAFVASPLSGPAEFALALFLTCAFCFVSPSADRSVGRARFEGLLAGAALFALWLLNPVFSLLGFIALSACPFLSGPRGLNRYASTLIVFAAIAGVAELLIPGVNAARAAAASGAFAVGFQLQAGESAMGLSSAAVSAALVIGMTFVFGGREHMRATLVALILAVSAFIAARIVGASALPIFAIAATMAAFSVASPLYDGVYRNHDRASVSVALCAGALPVFLTLAMLVHAVAQFSLQYQTARAAPQNIRTELALVQPGGPMIARWIEEGRFSTPEAREFLALAPVDQSAMLLEAASRARAMSARGYDVAILAGADAACILGEKRPCHADSNKAAADASVVFVPRLNLGQKASEAKGRAEALLYTQFRLVEETPFWEIWVRRGDLGPIADNNNNDLRGSISDRATSR